MRRTKEELYKKERLENLKRFDKKDRYNKRRE